MKVLMKGARIFTTDGSYELPAGYGRDSGTMILRRGRPYLIIGLAEPDAFLEYIGQNHDNRFSYNGDICTARQLAGRALYNFNQKRKGRARVDECMIGERMLLRRSDKKVNYDYPEKGDFFLSGIVSRIRQNRNSRYHHRRKR